MSNLFDCFPACARRGFQSDINRMTFNALLREPLTHFFAIGLLIFVVYAAQDRGNVAADGEVVIDDDRLTLLTSSFERTWQRSPTPSEMMGIRIPVSSLRTCIEGMDTAERY